MGQQHDRFSSSFFPDRVLAATESDKVCHKIETKSKESFLYIAPETDEECLQQHTFILNVNTAVVRPTCSIIARQWLALPVLIGFTHKDAGNEVPALSTAMT